MQLIGGYEDVSLNEVESLNSADDQYDVSDGEILLMGVMLKMCPVRVRLFSSRRLHTAKRAKLLKHSFNTFNSRRR